MLITRHQQDSLQRARLRWRARRGLLENDLLITRYLDRYEAVMSDAEVAVFSYLLDLSDNDLLDILLARAQPALAAMQTEELAEAAQKVIGQLRAI